MRGVSFRIRFFWVLWFSLRRRMWLDMSGRSKGYVLIIRSYYDFLRGFYKSWVRDSNSCKVVDGGFFSVGVLWDLR